MQKHKNQFLIIMVTLNLCFWVISSIGEYLHHVEDLNHGHGSNFISYLYLLSLPELIFRMIVVAVITGVGWIGYRFHQKLQRKRYEHLKNLGKIHMLLESADIGVWEWNEQDQKVYIQKVDGNKEYTFEEIKELIHSDDMESFLYIEKGILEGAREEISCTLRIKVKDLGWRWIFIQGKCFLSSRKGFEKSIGVYQDVTERKSMEQELTQNSMKLKESLRIARMGHWEYHHPTKKFSCSDEVLRMLGVSPSKIQESNLPIFEYLLKNVQGDRKEIIKEYLDSVERKQEYSKVIQLRIKEEKEKSFHVCGNHIYDRRDQVLSTFGTIQDITDMKKIEEASRYQKEFLNTLVENMPIAVMVKDSLQGYQYVLWNKAAEEILKISREEAIGETDFGLFDFHEAAYYRVQDKKVLKEKESLIFHEQECMVKKRKLLINYTKVPINDEAGMPTKLMVIMEDITQQKAMQDELRQAEKLQAIGQLAGGIAHDFNNQLMGILGYAALIEKDPLCEKNLKYIRAIIQGAQRSADLTQQLLTFSRKEQYMVGSIDVHALIQEVISFLSHSIDKKIHIEAKLEASNYWILGEGTQLQNALLNLAINARDAMPSGGTLTFRTKVIYLHSDESRFQELEPGQYIIVEVRDTGIGMPEEIRSRIFEPFFTTKPEGKGSGLGLSAVFGTIQSHKGRIEVESRVNKGTTFTLYLPLGEDAIKEEPKKQVQSIQKGTGTILVVDDEEIIRGLAVDLLESFGYSVISFGDEDKAITYYKEHWEDIDLVLLDMVMPNLTGTEVFRRLKEIHSQVLVLLMSGYEIKDEDDEIKKIGIKGIINKPISMEQLSKKVFDALRTKRAAKI